MDNKSSMRRFLPLLLWAIPGTIIGLVQIYIAICLAFSKEHYWFEGVFWVVNKPVYGLRDFLSATLYDGKEVDDTYLVCGLFVIYWALIWIGIGLLLRPLWRKLLPPDEDP